MAHTPIPIPIRRTGTGTRPLIALHGLGGTGAQPVSLLDDSALARFDVIAPDLRGHGSSTLPINPESLTFAQLADDIRVLLDTLDLDEPPVLMGISMGAGIALQLQDHPDRFAGTLLIRPAWEWQPNPANLDVFTTIAHLLEQYPADQARDRFLRSSAYESIATVSQLAAQALLPQFDEPHAAERRSRLTAMPADAPTRPGVITNGLVLGTDLDPVHPRTIAEHVAADTGAHYELVPPRYDDPTGHRAAIASALSRL